MTSTTSYSRARAVPVEPGVGAGAGGAGVRKWRVWAVSPATDRAELDALLGDLARQTLGRTAGGRGVELAVVLVHNGGQAAHNEVGVQGGSGSGAPGRRRALREVDVHLERNEGGSGGFNAGMRVALERLCDELGDDEGGLLWLLDSDARPEPGALRGLIEAMEASRGAVAVGSMLCNPDSGEPHELGGRVDRRTGEYVPNPPPDGAVGRAVAVEYAAACSLLVRAEAARRAGLMGELFVSGDDVEWCHRLRRWALQGRGAGPSSESWLGEPVLATPASRVRHPSPDKMRTWQRYYAARNAMIVLTRIGAGRRAVLARALRETARAVSQGLVGRDDLARLHIRGLGDAARGEVGAVAPQRVPGFRPWEELGESGLAVVALGRGLEAGIRERLVGVCEDAGVRVRMGGGGPVLLRAIRLALGRGPRVVAVSARARPADWLAGRTVVTCTAGGFAVRRIGLPGRLWTVGCLGARGVLLAIRLALLGAPASPRIGRLRARAPEGEGPPKTGVVVLSYNRKRAVLERLNAIDGDPAFETGCLLVVDNASTDGTREAVRDGGVSLLSMDENVGVAAFNRGVEAIDSEYVLILDDDAHPAEGALERAVEILDTRPEIAAVTLHPKHPVTLESEWRFARRAGASDAWPVMGCGNLVRRDDWMAAQGYEERFFLYRNDTDLALKLLSMGRGVHFDPDLVVWHDSLAIRRKSRDWFRGATRNWVWMCRRHGRGWTRAIGIAAGYAWAHRLAGLDPARHLAAMRGFAAGVLTPPPPMPDVCGREANALRRLLDLRFGLGFGRGLGRGFVRARGSADEHAQE